MSNTFNKVVTTNTRYGDICHRIVSDNRRHGVSVDAP